MKERVASRRISSESFSQAVYSLVAEIPVGKVITYGEIARLIGCPQASRRVGNVLKHVPVECVLPCHRVVNAQGRLVPGWEGQRSRLQEEGVDFRKNGNVDLKKALWRYEEWEECLLIANY